MNIIMIVHLSSRKDVVGKFGFRRAFGRARRWELDKFDVRALRRSLAWGVIKKPKLGRVCKCLPFIYVFVCVQFVSSSFNLSVMFTSFFHSLHFFSVFCFLFLSLFFIFEVLGENPLEM